MAISSGATESTRTPLDDATIVMDRKELRVLSKKPVDPIKLTASATDSDDGETLHCASVSYKLGFTEEEERFTNSTKIGEGAIGYVYAFRDENCSRQVAIKIPKTEDAASYPDEVKRFLAEANVAAELEHPNIIPVYDIDIDSDGKPFMAMRRVCGGTLRDYVMVPENSSVENMNDLIQVILKVCDALSFAHSKGRIHQDIKPENIMVGQYGEVFVIDWGSSSYEGDEMAVTPVYMSPQQALGQPCTPGDDVYCLGATLFHCLTGRMPTTATSLEELLEKKRSGMIAPFTHEEAGRISAPLSAIVLKALATDPNERYCTIADMAEDLKEFQAGNMVSAYDYSLTDFVSRWYRRHRQVIWFTAILLLVVLGTGIGLYQLKLKEMASWGQPVVVETFDDESWRDRWVIERGTGETRDGQLCTTSIGGFRMYYREKMLGACAIEFDGMIPPDAIPGDLSGLWCESFELDEEGKVDNLRNLHLIQTGAHGNSHAVIETPHGKADYSSFQLEIGRVYRIRIEVDQSRISLLVDGKLLCETQSLFPRPSGYIGLYGYYPAKTFDNVRVFRKGVAEKIPATRVGDSYYRWKLYERAAAEYRDVAASHPGKRIGEEATYKAGLSHYMLNDRARANSIWSQLKDNEMLNLVEAWRIRKLLEDEEFEEAIIRIRKLAASGKDGFRLASIAWEWGAKKTIKAGRYDATTKYEALHNEIFSNVGLHDMTLAKHLIIQGRFNEILENYSHISVMRSVALYRLGRYEQVLKLHKDKNDHCARALIRLKRWDELEVYTDRPAKIAQGLLWQRKYEEVLKRFPELGREAALALMWLGRYEEAADLHRVSGVEGLRFLGRTKEAFDRWRNATTTFREVCRFNGWNTKEYYSRLTPRGVVEQMIHGRGELEEARNYKGARRSQQTMALIFQGRFGEARKNKDQREAMAYLDLLEGKPQSVLRHCRDLDELYGRALLMTGEYQKVIDELWLTKNLPSLAYLYQGKPELVLKERKRDHTGTMMAMVDIALRDHRQGQAERGNRLLRSIHQDRVGYYDRELMLPCYIMRPLLLDSSGEMLRAAMKGYVTDRRHVFAQELWYLSRFILGEIDEAGFGEQPFKPLLESRLLLAKALKALLDSEPGPAHSYLKMYQALPRFKREQNPVIDHFVDWQLQATVD